MGASVASTVMQHLNPQEVKQISRAFMKVSEVNRETQLKITSEFRNMLKGGGTLVFDGREFAKSVISSAFGGDADRGGLLDYVNGTGKEQISKVFQDIPQKILAAFVASEHPQTAAFLLTKMDPDQAALILQTMEPDTQTEALCRISMLNSVKNDIVEEVREVLRTQLKGSSLKGDEEISGVKIAANILNFVERTTEERILAEVEENHPELAEQIRNLMFTFEDLGRMDGRSIQAILKEIPRDQLILSLKTASDELKALILGNVSQRAATMIQDDLSAMGPVKIRDVEKAQQGIIDIVRKLEGEGKVVLGGTGSDDAFI